MATDAIITRIRTQIQRFGLDTGDDKSKVVIDRDGEITITSACGGDVRVVSPSRLVAALERLPSNAAIGPCEAPEGEWSVWDVIIDNGREV